MARKIKERKVFGLKGFRGLDKENKPLKVAPFRAVDGKNFIIDSETLKTRPAFKYVDTPLAKLIDDIEIIDFYLYSDIYVYVTNKGIKIKSNGTLLDDITIPKLHTNVILERDFSEYNPIFQEEKEALFIFGLDNIYIVSKLYNHSNNELEHIFLYPLNEKILNPFTSDDSFFIPFEDMPKPYEPTLFIGDNSFEDVNLLSRVSKYKIFGNSSNDAREKTNTYYLPTHYNEEKNGELPEIEVSFYKNRYEGLQIFPIFLGIKNEGFEDETSYGNLINEQINLEEGYIAKEDFEYEFDGVSYIPIKEIVGVNKTEFYEMKIDGSGQKVFEFLLNYIEVNFLGNNMPNNENQVLRFVLPYERKSIYRNEEGKIDKISTERSYDTIYVQFKKFNLSGVEFLNKSPRSSEIIEEETSSPNWPNYPIIFGIDKTFYISEEPINRKNFNISDFTSLANTWLETNKSEMVLENNDRIELRGRLFELKNYSTGEAFADIGSSNSWYKSDIVPGLVYPLHPEFSNPNLLPVIEEDIAYSKSGQHVFVDDFYDQILNRIKFRLSELPNEKTEGFYKFRWYSYWSDGQGSFYEKCQSVVLKFSYQKKYEYQRSRRGSFTMTMNVKIDDGLVVDGLYDFTYDKNINSFVFKCKDYFYDYNNEPSIDIKVTFQNNPDYNIISNSRIGITFGSENRLFLAGNKDYPNIDRFNVSNDLLGNNIKNQSYELSYFPSRNYRVLGGKGAINGYVLATDTQLYVTKEYYPNDSKLFIRNRTMDDNGIVGYNEFKTNIDVSPLNEQSVVRFYNDILVLDKKGLYGLELSQNVLTNERLIKLRSGFVNNDLVDTIKKSNVKPFIFEDNYYMYIIIGKTIYVADSRYIAQNPNGVIENYSYEIVKWETHTEFKNMKYINGEKTFLDVEGKNIYKLVEGNSDEIADFKRFYMSSGDNTILNATYFYGENLKELLKDYKEVNFSFYNQKTYKLLAIENVDYTVDEIDRNVFEFNIINPHAFRGVIEGDKIVFEHNGNFIVREVENFDEFERLNFIIRNIEGKELSNIYKNLSEEKLYPKIIFESWNNPVNKRVILSPYKEEVIFVEKEDYENENDYYEEINSRIGDSEYYKYYFENEEMKDTLIIREKKIRLEWVSAILDFGNNFSEKTMFKTNIYGTKQQKENWIKFGYRTMRRFNRFDREGNLVMMKNAGKDIEVSNNVDFDEIDFNLFSINTFNEFGSSLPTKENNFLYIQFLIIGDGNVELNSLEFLYKFNRMLKTIA